MFVQDPETSDVHSDAKTVIQVSLSHVNLPH
jgi:hypothetical protein